MSGGFVRFAAASQGISQEIRPDWLTRPDGGGIVIYMTNPTTTGNTTLTTVNGAELTYRTTGWVEFETFARVATDHGLGNAISAYGSMWVGEYRRRAAKVETGYLA